MDMLHVLFSSEKGLVATKPRFAAFPRRRLVRYLVLIFVPRGSNPFGKSKRIIIEHSVSTNIYRNMFECANRIKLSE